MPVRPDDANRTKLQSEKKTLPRRHNAAMSWNEDAAETDHLPAAAHAFVKVVHSQ